MREKLTRTQARFAPLLLPPRGGYLSAMSTFRVNVTASNPKREELVTQPVSALVDTGSELTWLPADVLLAIGITPRRKRVFATATQQRFEREIGYAILSAEGYETTDEVVFAEPGDMTLLGVRTLEGFGVMVDMVANRFVATPTLAAPSQQMNPAHPRSDRGPASYLDQVERSTLLA
ncbi:MAG: hypothetical protein AABO41_19320 [Acidobacteriota bacterium]